MAFPVDLVVIESKHHFLFNSPYALLRLLRLCLWIMKTKFALLLRA